MTIRKLRERLTFWQSLLNIGEWSITVRHGTHKELTDEVGNVCAGLNYIQVEHLDSEIVIRRGEGEDTLVHELLHVVFDGHKDQQEPYDIQQERAINRTAAALVHLLKH